MEKLKVLIVDDEPEFVNALAERLSFRDIYAEGAPTGEEAITLLQDRNFDVVLLDVKMPGWCCNKVMLKIKETRPESKIILITGYGANIEGEGDVLEKAYRYFAKPIDIDDLVRALKEAAQKEE